MSEYIVQKKYTYESKEGMPVPLTASQVIEQIRELKPEGYDIDVITEKGTLQKTESDKTVLIYNIKADKPVIALLLDETGRDILSTHLFVK